MAASEKRRQKSPAVVGSGGRRGRAGGRCGACSWPDDGVSWFSLEIPCVVSGFVNGLIHETPKRQGISSFSGEFAVGSRKPRFFRGPNKKKALACPLHHLSF